MSYVILGVRHTGYDNDVRGLYMDVLVKLWERVGEWWNDPIVGSSTTVLFKWSTSYSIGTNPLNSTVAGPAYCICTGVLPVVQVLLS